jgi:hypothetical protein
MMLPPKSGRKAVRLRNASTVSALMFIYSDIMAVWISNQDVDANLIPRVRTKFLALGAQLQALRMQTAVAKWEGSIRGAWPAEEYMKLINVQADMMSSMALVGLWL